MRNNLVFYLCFFVFANCLFAQKEIPGYMGKRFFLGYGLKLSPAIQGPTLTSSSNGYLLDDELISKEVVILGINHSHSLSMDYLFNYRKALSINIQYLRTGVDYQNYGAFSVIPQKNVSAILNSLGLSFGVKFFKRSQFAPLGGYVKWEGVFFVNQLNYDRSRYIIINYNTGLKTVYGNGKQSIPFQTMGIAFSFGKQTMLYDKVLLDRGIRFLFIPQGFTAFGAAARNQSPPTFMESGALIRLFRHQLINLNLAVMF